MSEPTGVTPTLVHVEDLSVHLGGRDVLHSVGFDIPRGGSLALVGESGSGKTVTARVLTGLLERIGGTVTSGTVTFDGIDLRTADAAQWRQLHGRRMAVVPQASLSSLNPVVRIGRQLRETIRELDPDADPKARALELLELVHLPKPAQLVERYPHELSGGMRQRVMIALALVSRPDLIVADEPTTALDVTVQAGILRLLGEVRAETGASLLMIAHDLAVVEAVADSVAVMRQGVIVEQGPARSVLLQPSHNYTRALLAARPESARKGYPLAVLNRDTGTLDVPATPGAGALGTDPADAYDVTVPGEVVISARGVGMLFPHQTEHSLKDVDLDICAGAAIGIVGESGSGKTTLGRALVGALHPTDGEVLVEGAPWTAIKRNDPRRREVQMIFQDPYGSLTPWRTPRQVVAEVMRLWEGMSKRDASAAAEQLLLEVGLPAEAMDRLPGQLSGGQCQRVGIARALAANPRVLVADEPTSSLDVSVQAQILNLLMRLRVTRKLALVLVSHDLTVVRHMTDDAIVMRHGVVVERGSSEKLFTDPEHEYTRQLVESTPKISTGVAG
jgi:peptide/nickel transport system ATP-binding protein